VCVTDVLSPLGKIPLDLFERVIGPRLGAARDEVIVGPRTGVDSAIVRVAPGVVLAVTADPFYVDQRLGWERAGWFAVHIVASDLATTGLRPSYLALDLNLPLETADADLASLWESVDTACADLGMAIVTGHTGRYDGCSFPMIGGATVMGVGNEERYVTPSMTSPGDMVLITKGAAIETTAVFGVLLEGRIRSALGVETARAAAGLFSACSVVDDALLAAEVGVRNQGVTAMHDATERGVLNGLWEVARASGTGLVVDQAAIPLLPEVAAVCELFEIDPYAASSEGTLLLTCKPRVAQAVISRLDDAGIRCAVIGEMLPPEMGAWIVRDGREIALEPPAEDPFWPALQRALSEGDP
jgi:hydrogenase expression/formation protein HypE